MNNTDVLTEALKQLSIAMPDTKSVFRDVNISALSQIDEVSKAMKISSKEITDIVGKALISLKPINVDIPTELIEPLLKLNFSSYAEMVNLDTTPMLEALKKAMVDSNYQECASVISEALKQSSIAVPDFSFLKTSDNIKELWPEIDYPKGFKKALKDVNVATMQRIANKSKLFYETSTASFAVKNDETVRATPSEMNVLCSGADMFDALEEGYITEVELMNFMSFLQNERSFGIKHPVGKKIYHIIKEIVPRVSFDCERYYHSRALDKEAPFTSDEMLTAPSGVTGPGRYNHPGQAFYYFANTQFGSEAEVKKHNKGKRIQTAVVCPNKQINMIDLSGESRKGSTFLKYIRFPAEGIMPKEYLIPCFVSDCCRDCGIDGIKYYGTKKYTNYVSWNAGYFDFVRMEKLTEPE